MWRLKRTSLVSAENYPRTMAKEKSLKYALKFCYLKSERNMHYSLKSDHQILTKNTHSG